jgi:hypothetical protein
VLPLWIWSDTGSASTLGWPVRQHRHDREQYQEPRIDRTFRGRKPAELFGKADAPKDEADRHVGDLLQDERNHPSSEQGASAGLNLHRAGLPGRFEDPHIVRASRVQDSDCLFLGAAMNHGH